MIELTSSPLNHPRSNATPSSDPTIASTSPFANNDSISYSRLKYPLLDITNKANNSPLNYIKPTPLNSPIQDRPADLLYDNFYVEKTTTINSTIPHMLAAPTPQQSLFMSQNASLTTNDLNSGLLPRTQSSGGSTKTIDLNHPSLQNTPSTSWRPDQSISLSQEWYDKSDCSPLPHKSRFNQSQKMILSDNDDVDSDKTDNDDDNREVSTDDDESTDNTPIHDNDDTHPPYLGSSEVESDNDYTILREDDADYLSMTVPLPPPPCMNTRFKGKGRSHLLRGSLGVLQAGNFSNTSLSSISSLHSTISLNSNDGADDGDATFTVDSLSSLCLPDTRQSSPSKSLLSTFEPSLSFAFPPLPLSLTSSVCTSPITSALPSPVPTTAMSFGVVPEKKPNQRTIPLRRPSHRKAISTNNIFLKPNPLLTAACLSSSGMTEDPTQNQPRVVVPEPLASSTLDSIFCAALPPPYLSKFNSHQQLASSPCSGPNVNNQYNNDENESPMGYAGATTTTTTNNNNDNNSSQSPATKDEAYYQGLGHGLGHGLGLGLRLGLGKKVKIRRTQSMYQHPHDVVSRTPDDSLVLSPSVKRGSNNNHKGRVGRGVGGVGGVGGLDKVGGGVGGGEGGSESSPPSSPAFSHISSNSLLFARDRPPFPYHRVDQDNFPRITRETLCDILDGKFNHLYARHMIVDCRFEYEYAGGHIGNAININHIEQLQSEIMASVRPGEKVLVIMHCEYSAYRGPLMANHLRNMDRRANLTRYPELYFPDIVLLQGGYKAFFDGFAHRCEPQMYVEMNCDKFKAECEREMDRVRRLKFTRSKSVCDRSLSSSSSLSTHSPRPSLASKSHTLAGRASTLLTSSPLSSTYSPSSSISSPSSTSSFWGTGSHKIMASANSLVSNSRHLASKSKSTTLGLGLKLRRSAAFSFPSSLSKDDSDEEMEEDGGDIHATPTQRRRDR